MAEAKLKRLKAKEQDYVRLDAGVLKTLFENQHLIPEKWKEKTNGNTTFIFFDGTVLLNSLYFIFASSNLIFLTIIIV